MPRRSHVDRTFVEHVCGRIDKYIREQALTDVEAAAALGVRKQMIGPYRRGEALPGTEVLARACTEWGLTFQYRGRELGARAEDTPTRLVAVPHQLMFSFDEPIRFRGISPRAQNVEVELILKRVS